MKLCNIQLQENMSEIYNINSEIFLKKYKHRTELNTEREERECQVQDVFEKGSNYPARMRKG